ncbi:hypothetical protein TRFO_27100 [Tritrichomonas foetus]|uniref:Uncharacterized protein n=1 Tax=Tritrichomonas foetus TaxID=1144522 RepID=A0A1J4K1H1_9EUKA|nr:hypothetical protein TRFO_27100 [Tritrichomonas foetus]|eukprot:OHT05231.1 hypothetical protein TRFO_27100 [Tritrichomonas foetus]
MNPEKLNFYSKQFHSQEIKDADEFEKNAITFRNEFVELKYDVIQPKFDTYFQISLAIASHYRPVVQTNGCDCLFVICDQAAPAQIKRVAPQLQKCYDQLIQVGNSEVIPSLMPALEKSIEYVYDNPSSQIFHDFFMHYLETWSREATTVAASFSYARNFIKIAPFLGMSASRYVRPILAVIAKRLSLTQSKTHALAFLRVVTALSEQIWPVIKTHEDDIKKIIENARLINTDNNDIDQEIQKLEEILKNSPEPLKL